MFAKGLLGGAAPWPFDSIFEMEMTSCLTFSLVALFVQSQIATASQQQFTYVHKQDFHSFSYFPQICYSEQFFTIHMKDIKLFLKKGKPFTSKDL